MLHYLYVMVTQERCLLFHLSHEADVRFEILWRFSSVVVQKYKPCYSFKKQIKNI